MPVAAMAMIPAPAYCSIGMKARTPIAMHDQIGVCSFGLTAASHREPGNVSSRDMPKHRRMVDVMIERQQTKIAAETTMRNAAENAEPKFDSMMLAGPKPPLIAAGRSRIPSSMQKRKMPPITNAPTTD